MSTPFRERNPVIIGAVSLAVIAALILAAFRAQDLPLIGGGDVYYAAFSESGGHKANDEVRIAGVRVGKVEEVTLDGDHVRVAFRVDSGNQFGTETAAAIKIKTLLGSMYLALQPAGSGQMAEESEIPEERMVEIAAQIEDSAEVRDVVHGLEQQYDAFHRPDGDEALPLAEETELPTGEELGAEFERFLAGLDRPDE